MLAVLSFLVLHSMAGLPVPPSDGVSYLPSLITAQFISGLAVWLQYPMPSLLLLWALYSFWCARRHEEDEANPTLQALQGIGWEEFELLMAAAFQKRGYTVRSRSGAVSQGGVDVVLTKRCEVFLVQGSQWRARQVGAQPVRELQAVMAAARASGGFVLSAGQFSAEAQHFAREHHIELIEGPALLQLIQGLDCSTLMPEGLPTHP
ncbi:restriction endonuclease [Chitinimonas sp. BJB300]|uniref:restriction endonuclease n=1 Tax=Chitinimonas sp. BJB300 TaxID=1559339 RepID=UPI0016430510|nr:restriction endonuclease [Chitinimonas sp. BJB300]